MDAAKVLITDHPWPDLEIEHQILTPLNVEVVAASNPDEETLSQLARDVVAIATCWAKVSERVIRSATQCRLISRMGIGLDNIDLAVATERKIPVTNVPDYCVEEVADHTLGLILALARNLGFYHLRTKMGEYDLQAGPLMHRLRGKRLGLVGFGRIGRDVFYRATAFGLEVVATTPSGNAYGTPCQMVSLEELAATADFISLHAPLSSATHHLIDAGLIARMKKGVYLVNTSRGPLIDATALSSAISSGQIAGAGLDVFEPEPPDLSLPLYRDERVIITPHAAFVSREALGVLRTEVANQIAAMLTGKQPRNIVNGMKCRHAAH